MVEKRDRGLRTGGCGTPKEGYRKRTKKDKREVGERSTTRPPYLDAHPPFLRSGVICIISYFEYIYAANRSDSIRIALSLRHPPFLSIVSVLRRRFQAATEVTRTI